MKHAQSFLSTADAGKVMAWLVIGGVVLALVFMARALARMAKHIRPPVPVPAPSSGLSPKVLLLGAAAAAGGFWYETRHKAAAAAGRAAPAPSPSPQPTVTRTVTPHAAPHAAPHLAPHLTFLDHLTGTDWTVITVVALLVAYAIVRPLLGRSS